MNAEIFVMASGKGTRLAPYSLVTEGNLPKQFLNVVGNNTMIQDTVLRIPKEYSITVVPEVKYVDVLKCQMSQINREVNILAEPYSGNTALLLLLGTLYSQNKNSDDTVLFFLPSDAVMETSVFQKVMSNVMNVFENYPEANDNFVTIGIEPNRPETNYGYIKVGDKIDNLFHKVKEFKEKPRFEVAERYVESGNYLWNAGIFAFKAKTLIEAMKKHAPNLYEKLDLVKSDLTIENVKKAYDYISQKEKISIDFAVMQKVDNILLVPASKELKWDDVGSWAALDKYNKSDVKNNVSNLFNEDGSYDQSKLEINKVKNCSIYNYSDKKIVLDDCEDLDVILAKSGCFISPRKKSHHAKEVIPGIEKKLKIENFNCNNTNIENETDVYVGAFDLNYVNIKLTDDKLEIHGDPKSKINVRSKR